MFHLKPIATPLDLVEVKIELTRNRKKTRLETGLLVANALLLARQIPLRKQSDFVKACRCTYI